MLSAGRLMLTLKVCLQVSLFLLVGIVSVRAQSPGSDKALAESAAMDWVNGMSAQADQAYTKIASPTFKQAVSFQQFTTNIAVWKIQAGGPPANVAVVGSTYFTQAPNGAVGDFYYARLKAGYPNGKLFIDIYLSKIGPAWKVDGFTYAPAPP